MKVQVYSAPASEPVTLSQLLLHLRQDSGSFSDVISSSQSIAPGSKAIANNYTTHVGASVDVLGLQAIVNLVSGTNGAGGTVDCKIQESDNGSTWTDWAGGVFTQVTTVNDNATYEIAYTGSKRYIKTVAKVLVAACEFGTNVITYTGDAVLDDELEDAIGAGRIHIENITGRKLITQTIDYYLDEFPSNDFIKLPFGNLQSVTHIKYTNSDGVQTPMTVTTEYLVETNGEGCGRIVLPYGKSWPDFTAYPSNPIVIRFICGWVTASAIPKELIQAVKFAAQNDYYNGDRDEVLSKLIEKKIASYKLWDNFA